jgi:hypothetical protein
VVNTSGSLFRYTIAAFQHFWVFLVNQGRKISTVVEDQVQALAVLECNELLL